jgi:hypothetical protein
MFTQDFINTESFASDVTDSMKISVIPIISVTEDIFRNTSYRYTDEELEALNEDGCYNSAEEKIENNLNNLKDVQIVQIANQVTSEPTTAELTTSESNSKIDLETTTRDIEYEIIRNAAIKQLQDNNIYFVSNESSTLPVVDFNREVATTLSTQSTTYSQVYTTKVKETTKKYKSKKKLKEEHPELVSEAEKQESSISQKYEEENSSAKAEAESEASSKASEKSKENESKADQEIAEKNTTAKVEDSKGNEIPDVTVKPSSNIGNVVIDDNHTTTNKDGESDKNFDGPIYDQDGNIIAGRISVLPNVISKFLPNLVNNTKVFMKSLRK